jgi:uncharacterized protein YaaQ
MPGKMIMCIVHPEDADGLTKELNDKGFRVTRASTTGGFLRQGMSTVLIGVHEEQVDDVMTIIRENTHPRSRKGWWLRPGRHQAGAATVFVLDMEQAQLSEMSHEG